MFHAFADFEVSEGYRESDRSVGRMVGSGVSGKMVGEARSAFASFAYNAGYTEKGEVNGRTVYFNRDGNAFRALLGVSSDNVVAAAYAMGADNAALMFQGSYPGYPVPAGWGVVTA